MNEDEIIKEKVPVFMKEQILASEKYKDHRDALSVILSGDVNYTLEEIEQKLKEFMERKV